MLSIKDQIKKASEIVRQSGIVIFPTETAFGVGCRIDSEKAVERLFKIRNRPENQATPVLISSIEMAQKYLKPISKDVKKLMQKYWPGALTIVYPCQPRKASPFVLGGGLNLGVRMPDHPVPYTIIDSLGVPILGPSANFHGAPTPYKYEDLDPEFVKLVDYVLFGKCPVGMASTVVDCSAKPWKIIRQGKITIDSITSKQ